MAKKIVGIIVLVLGAGCICFSWNSMFGDFPWIGFLLCGVIAAVGGAFLLTGFVLIFSENKDNEKEEN